GVGREVAHEVIKGHAVAAALSMREGRENNLLEALSLDERIPFNRAELEALIGAPIDFTGDAREQVARVVAKVEAIAKRHPEAASYQPGSIR
ncbi:MAG: hypothetical protein RL399_447, partial [Actinomycetota bacterium]